MENTKKIKLFIGLSYLFIVCLFLYFFFSKFSLQEIKSFTNYEFIKNKIINYEKLPTIIGCEINKKVFEQANVNISLAGLENYIELINNEFLELQLQCKPGIIICNPPYGKKLGDENELICLYEQMGIFLKNNFSGWAFWLLSGNPKLTKYLKMKSSLKIPVSNGGIDCRWIKYLIR